MAVDYACQARTEKEAIRLLLGALATAAENAADYRDEARLRMEQGR